MRERPILFSAPMVLAILAGPTSGTPARLRKRHLRFASANLYRSSHEPSTLTPSPPMSGFLLDKPP